MKDETTIEPYYQRQARDLIDLLSDKGFLNPELSREGERWLEDYLGYLAQSSAQMSAKTALLTARLKS